LVDRIKGRFTIDGRVPRIYTTGHSLGGGLAQEAGYLSGDIKEVFAFNSSPVTNWSYLRPQSAVKQAYPIFHRVNHGGELLETPRFVSTAFTQARFGRHDLTLQFLDKKSISGHSMSVLACHFADLIAAQASGIGGAHNYSVDYIRKSVLMSSDPANKPVCNKEEDGAGA
jgi:hypothetical protein